jgi:O-antigen/teichoic acid export membrane protein
MSQGLSNRLFMTLSVFLRMGAGLLVLVVLARTLGPTRFGFVSTVFAYAALAGLLTDFGFSLKTLRDIAAAPDRGGEILGITLRIKALLTCMTVAGGLGVLCILPLGMGERLAGGGFASGLLVGAVGDLALVAFRATGNFRREAWIVSWTSGAHGLLVIPAALSHAPLWAIAVMFLVSRSGYAFASVRAALRLLPPGAERSIDLKETGKALLRSVPWATDNALTYLNSQIDALLMVPLLGFAAAGVYQSGARLVQASLAVAAVLSNIHIPAVAAHGVDHRISRAELTMILEFTGLGTFWALAFIFLGPLFTHLVLGDAYARLDQLWPGFAAFVLARYIAASLGSALAALAKPGPRVAAQLCGLGAILYGFFWILPTAGLTSVPWIMAMGSAATLVLFALARVTTAISAKEPQTAASN